MKKAVIFLLCLLTICSFSNTSKIYAIENENNENAINNSNNSKTEKSVSNDAVVQDEVLSNFNENSITINNKYTDLLEKNKDENPAYNQYKDYDVLYQQNTGINSLETLHFDATINGKNNTYIGLGKTLFKDTGHTLTINVENNPAENKEFIKTPQDFDIVINFTLTNQDGESVSFKKNLKAKVVEVVGKIINRKAEYKFEECMRYEDVNSHLNSIHKKLKVQLLNNSIIDVIGLANQWGMSGGPNGDFSATSIGVYDLKYLLEDATHVESLVTTVQGYIIDNDNNIVDYYGNVVIPYEKRESKDYSSTNTDVKLNAKTGTIPDNAVLESIENNNLDLNQQYVAYDMNIISNGKNIQPVGIVDLSINIPNKLKEKEIGVYYLNDDGSLEELDSTINEGTITFATSHFSTYVLIENEKQETSPKPVDPIKPEQDNTSTGDTKPKQENTTIDTNSKENSKSNTPKTGIATANNYMPLIYVSILTIGGAIIFILKKKKTLLK